MSQSARGRRRSTAPRTGVKTSAAGHPGGKGSRRRRHNPMLGRRRMSWGVVVGVAVVVALAAAIGYVVSRGHDSGTAATPSAQIIPATPQGPTTVAKAPTRVSDTSGIPGVMAWDTQGWPGDGASHPGALQHDHVTGPVRYSVLPPVGGPHNPVWMNAGVYTAPIPAERAVHNLEHGAVWITYRPDLSAAQVATLTAFVGKQSMIPESQQASGVADQANRYVDLSPWADNTLPSPIVLSAWGHQLRVTSASDPRMQKFVDTFRHSPKYTPEYGAAVDGVPVDTGGRPASDGSRQPNPPGSAS